MAEGLSQLAANSLFSVSGWVAVVTGGGTGLGLMAAKALAANGAKVYITGRRLDRLQGAEMQDSQSGGSIIGLQMDVTSKDSIKSAVETISQKETFVNILVNNAGISLSEYGEEGRPQGTPEQISETMMNNEDFDVWARVYKVNTASIYFMSVAFLPLLCAARKHGFPDAGSIINISSISGITKDSQDGNFSYNCSKAGAISLTQMLAMEFMRPELEVRVNTIAPGWFPSEMVSSLESTHKGKGKEFFRDLNGFGIPFGRPGNPREFASAILNFAVNTYCTGSTLVVDGGWLLAHC